MYENEEETSSNDHVSSLRVLMCVCYQDVQFFCYYPENI